MYTNLNYESYYGISVVTPTKQIIYNQRIKREEFTRHIIGEGKYEDVQLINEVVQKIYGYLNEEFNSYLDKVSNKETFVFLQRQYDATFQIEHLSRCSLNPRDQTRWNERQGLRRGLKYILEKMLENGFSVQYDDNHENLENLVEIAEMCVDFSRESDLIHGLRGGHPVLKIYPRGCQIYYDLYFENIPRDGLQKSLYSFRDFIKKNGTVDEDFKSKAEELLNNPFFSIFHFQFSKIDEIYDFFINYKKEEFDVVSVSKEMFINDFCSLLKIQSDDAEKFLYALTLKRSSLLNEPRELFKTNQKNRLFFKFLLEYEENGKTNITYSRSMAIESYMLFNELFEYDSLPSEWKNDFIGSREIENAVASLLNYYGHKFETFAINYLKKMSICGKSYRDHLPSGETIPSSVGEIDFIGVEKTKKVIVCFEFKNVKGSTDPRQFRNDLDKFIYNKKSYLKKYKKKIEFVSNNIESLAKYYSNVFHQDFATDRILTALITYLPNVSRYFITDIMCLSLSDFEKEFIDNDIQFTQEIRK